MADAALKSGSDETAGARAAVFVDRDNSLIDDPGYLRDPAQVRLLPGVAQAIARLRAAGLPVIVVTNQSGVARGYFTEHELALVHQRMQDLLRREGDGVDAIYYCPYLTGPDAVLEEYRRDSDLRKPKPGMLFKAAEEMRLDLAASWMIGDSSRDIVAGRAAGCRTIMIGRAALKTEVMPDYFAADLPKAADIVLAELEKQRAEAAAAQARAAAAEQMEAAHRAAAERAQSWSRSATAVAETNTSAISEVSSAPEQAEEREPALAHSSRSAHAAPGHAPRRISSAVSDAVESPAMGHVSSEFRPSIEAEAGTDEASDTAGTSRSAGEVQVPEEKDTEDEIAATGTADVPARRDVESDDTMTHSALEERSAKDRPPRGDDDVQSTESERRRHIDAAGHASSAPSEIPRSGPFEGTGSSRQIESQLSQILDELRAARREQRFSEFSLAQLAGAIAQAFALCAVGFGLYSAVNGDLPGAEVRLLVGIAFQIMALSGFIISRRR